MSPVRSAVSVTCPCLPARRTREAAAAAAGSVTGFPLLSTLALRTPDTSHAAALVGLLPLATVGYATARAHHRPSPAFWVAAVAGAALVVGFTAAQSGGTPTTGDLYLFCGVVIRAAAYGEGARLTRELPGWQVNAWALLLSLPRAVVGVLWLVVGASIVGLALWHRGLALACITRASQLQLAQPLLTLLWSVLLRGENPPASTLGLVLGVPFCIADTQRARD
nr:EamA family transporter [Streptomyces avicenniae]